MAWGSKCINCLNRAVLGAEIGAENGQGAPCVLSESAAACFGALYCFECLLDFLETPSPHQHLQGATIGSTNLNAMYQKMHLRVISTFVIGGNSTMHKPDWGFCSMPPPASDSREANVIVIIIIALASSTHNQG